MFGFNGGKWGIELCFCSVLAFDFLIFLLFKEWMDSETERDRARSHVGRFMQIFMSPCLCLKVTFNPFCYLI